MNIDEVNDEDIKTEDVQRAISKMEDSKLPEMYVINTELIRYRSPELVTELPKLFQKITRYGTIQEEWRTSITIPVYGKGVKPTYRIKEGKCCS